MSRIFAIAITGLAAWAGTAWGDLPEGYTAIDGIASTSGGNQYILTDYVPSSSSIKIEATVTLTKWGTQGIWCSRSGTNDKTMTLFCWASPSYFRLDRNGNTGTYAGKGPSLNTKTVLTGDYGALKFYVDGVDVGKTMASGDFTPAAKLSFFASQVNGGGWGNYAVMTIHGVKIYNTDGTLEREYVPAQCAANAGKTTEYGLYETQEGKFFTTPSTKGFTPVMEATSEWSEDAAKDALVLTVSGTYAMTEADATRITETTHANFIKRGTGTLIGQPIQAFTGNITVEQGIFRLAHQYDCGADNTGWIRVCDKATLEVKGFVGVEAPRAITGKTIYTTGNGYGGMGALAGGCSWNSCSNCRFILEGDSYYTADAEFNFVTYIDLAGHKLKGRQATTNTRWGISANTITNSVPSSPATFEFVGGMFRPETLSYFRGAATDGVVKLYSDTSATTVIIPTYGISSTWPIELGPNVSYSARAITNHSDSAYGLLNAPLTLKGAVKLATDISNGKPSLVNLKGTLTGSGTTDIGTGWVNYHTTANDYTGAVTVKRSASLASDDYRAGFAVRSGATYSASQTTLEDGDIELGNGVAPVVEGPICFTGGNQSRLTGGCVVGERTNLSVVRKEGAGELLLSAAVAITGRLEIAAGKVRLPSKTEYMPVVGKPGLMGSVTNATVWRCDSPLSGDQGDFSGSYNTLYPFGTDLTSRWNGTGEFGPRTTFARGYIWNRTDADVTWTFKANHSDIIWFWLDDEVVFSAQRMNQATSLATKTLTPGPHKFVLITASSATSKGPQYVNWKSGLGSLYDSMPVDFQGRGETTAANFSQLIDSGDGSLFTIDDTRTEDLTDPFWLASVETLAAASGAEFDAGGYDYAVSTLEGFPKVTDVGTLTVKDAWLLDDAGIAAGQPMTVAGTLACGEGAVLGLKTPWANLPGTVLTKLDAGLTIATATAFSGTPTLSAELQAAGAVLSLGADGKSLVLRVPSDRYVKAVAGGVEVSYKVKDGLPGKEVRIDVYRDGVLVDQKFVGNAYGKFQTTWKLSGDGYFFATATLVAEDGTESKTVFGEQLVSGSNIAFVSPEETEGEFTSVRDAIDSLGEAGGRVYVRPGRYQEVFGGTAEAPLTNGVELATAVQVIGLTSDPADVVVTRKDGNRMRIFRLNHADAALRFLTVEGGYQAANDYLLGNGGNVLIDTKGGTVENCVIQNGSTMASWPGGGGNVALFNGTLRNCVLIGGVNSTDTTNMWVNCGGSLLLYQRAGCAPVAENCLITGCVSADRSGCAPIGLYGDAKLVNCTVAGNAANISGGVMISKLNSKLPQIVNCAFFDNTMRATPASDAQVVYHIVSTYRNNAANTPSPEEAAACFVNCAAPVALNSTCIATTTPDFVDAVKGDYRLTAESPLVNAGYNTKDIEGIGQNDLLGAPRFVKGVDIGCYERQAPKFKPKGFYIILRGGGYAAVPGPTQDPDPEPDPEPDSEPAIPTYVKPASPASLLVQAPPSDAKDVTTYSYDGIFGIGKFSALVANDPSKAADNASNLNAMIKKGGVLHFPAGTYYVGSRIDLGTSVTLWGVNAEIVRTGVSNQNSTPYANNAESGSDYNWASFGFITAGGVTIRGLTFRYDVPTCFTAEILSVKDDGSQRARLVDGRDSQFNADLRFQRINSFTADGRPLELDLIYGSGTTAGTHYKQASSFQTDAEGRKTFALWLGKDKVSVGDRVALCCSTAYSQGFIIANTSLMENITFEDVTVANCFSMTMVVKNAKNLTLRRFRVKDETPGAIFATGMDGIHVAGLAGKLTMEDCEFQGLADDMLNVHATAASVGSVSGTKVTFANQIEAASFMKGETVKFYTAKFEDLGTATVTAVTGSTSGMTALTVDALPEGVGEGCLIGNETKMPEVEISKCWFGCTRARGILLQTDAKVTVKDSYFHDTRLAGILLSPSATGQWAEMGPLRDVTITNCAFEACGVAEASTAAKNNGAIVIRCNHDQDSGWSYSKAANRNISILGNQFKDCVSAGVFAANTTGLTVRGNTFWDCGGRVAELDDAIVRVEYCASVTVADNVSYGTGYKNAVTAAASTAVTDSNNQLNP